MRKSEESESVTGVGTAEPLEQNDLHLGQVNTDT